jgi:hypothetical protein
MSGIFLNGDGGLTQLAEAPYVTEALLQELLARNPALLATGPADPPLLLIRREAPVYDDQSSNAHGTLDHLFIDADGVPVLVEVKRSSDTRLRREVVGQMLDYATGASNWKVDRLQDWLAERCTAEGLDVGEVLDAHSDDPADFWQRVGDHLDSGRLRLYFVADVISPTLRAIVEWLNEQLKACTVLAVEVKQYLDANGQQTIVVPTVLGNTARAEAEKGAGTRKWRRWNLDQVRQELADHLRPEDLAVADALVAWGKRRQLKSIFGHGVSLGSVQYGIDDGQRRIFPFVLYTDGTIEIPLLFMGNYAPYRSASLRHAYRERLNQLGLATRFGPETVTKRPSFKIGELRAPPDLESFLNALEWALEQNATEEGGW